MKPSSVTEDWEKLLKAFSEKNKNLSAAQIHSVKSVFFAGVLAQYDFHRKLGSQIAEGLMPIGQLSKACEDRDEQIHAMALEIGFDLEAGKPVGAEKTTRTKQKSDLN